MPTAQSACKEKRLRKWTLSDTWAHLYKVMYSVEEKLWIEIRQDGMVGGE